MIPALNPNIAKTIAEVDKNPKVKSGLVNLGSNKLNINTTTAKGLEKGIGVIAKFIIKAQGKINKIFYGEYKLKKDEGNAIKRALDKGIDNLLTEFTSVDFCNLLNYAINKIPGGKPFDPKEPIPTDLFSKAKWNLQNTAFKVQGSIDQYYASYGDASNPESKLGLSTLIRQINDLFSTVFSQDEGFNNPDLVKAFPEISIAKNFIDNALKKFTTYSNVQTIPNEDIKKLISLVDKIKFYCITIQGLNSIASAVNFAGSFLDPKTQDELARINKLVPLKDVSKVLKEILKVANNLNSIGQNCIKYINTGRTIIKIAVLIIKVFNVVKGFFLGNPLPNMFTTAGMSTLFSDVYQEKISNNGIKKLIKRLNQINAVLGLMQIFVTSLVAILGIVIQKLNFILLNIENCSNLDPELKQDLINTITNLTNTANNLQDFLDKSNRANDNKNIRFADYTIEIITEQLADEGIQLKRRYGIARSSSGYIVVESTPTFASLDLIIINEVKVLLVSKGFVSSGAYGLSSEDEVTIVDSLNYLDDNDIDLANISIFDQDIQNYKDQDDEIGLSTFINNLPGGKSLRDKVRKMLSKQSEKLKSNLDSTDPQGKYSRSISGVYGSATGIVVSQTVSKNAELERLEADKARLQKSLTQLATSPQLFSSTVNKIKEIDAQLKKLKNS